MCNVFECVFEYQLCDRMGAWSCLSELQLCGRRTSKNNSGPAAPRSDRQQHIYFADENSATTESDIEETLKRLVGKLKTSPQEFFKALKDRGFGLDCSPLPVSPRSLMWN